MSLIYWTGATSGDWGVTTNWSGGVVPVNSDDVVLTNNAVDITAGLNQSAVTLTSLTIDSSYTGLIGAAGTYLQINSGTLTVGRQYADEIASGSTRIHLNGTFTTANVIDAGTSSSDDGFPALCLKGTTTTLNVRSGRVGVAALTPAETATITTLNVNQSDNAGSPPVIVYGLVTTTTINQDAGTIYSRATATVTTANIHGGEYRVDGTSAHTTINVEGGKIVYNGTGTITTLNLYGEANFSNNPTSKTVTNCNVYEGANLDVNTGVAGSIVFTNGIILHGCDVDKIKLRVGNDRTISLS